MDYAKYAYLKAVELESQKSTDSQKLSNVIEFAFNALNKNVSTNYVVAIGSVWLYGKTYIQNKVVVETENACDVSLEIFCNNELLIKENRSLSIGETEIVLMKTYVPMTNLLANLSCKITVLSNGQTVKINSNITEIWGMAKESDTVNSVDMKVLSLSAGTLVSYIDNGKVFYNITSVEEKTISNADFSFVANGISHCFAKHKTNQDVYFFRVDYNGNLYYSKLDSMQSETLLDTAVASVYARECPTNVEEDILVCYIKNAEPVYRTIKGNSVGSACVLGAPTDKYVDVYIADAASANKMYVVCTNNRGGNYILFSQEESMLTGFAESLNASVAIFVKRYVNLNSCADDCCAHINLSATFNVSTNYLNYASFLATGIAPRLVLSSSFGLETYQIETDPEINYTMQFDQKIKYSSSTTPRITMSDDCAGWRAAGVYPRAPQMGFTDLDNVMGKWPFNLIKPCLMQNGQIVGYLKPDDYSKFEDGTSADITSGQYEVMIQFPKIYWKIEEDWDGVRNVSSSTRANITVKVSNKKKQGYVCHSHMKSGQEYDFVYVGAYESNVSNGNLYCCSGKLPTSDVSHIDIIRNWSTYRGSEYTTLNYHFSTYLYILSMLLFQEHYGYDIYGYGYISSSESSVDNSGVLNQAGLFYGTNSTTGSHNKLFGLENLWNHSKTYIDGILIDSNRHVLIIDNTSSSSYINLQAVGYVSHDIGLSSSISVTAYTTLFTANNNFGFLPVAYSGLVTNRYYHEIRNCIMSPSDYTNYTPTADCPYMMCIYGGTYERDVGFGIVSDRDFNPTSIYHNERIMCYPNSKKSS